MRSKNTDLMNEIKKFAEEYYLVNIAVELNTLAVLN